MLTTTRQTECRALSAGPDSPISRRGAGRWCVVIIVLLAAVCSSSAEACNIPVFRYALERWKSDAYEVVVFYDQQLTAEQAAFLQRLTAASNSGRGHANIKVVRSQVGANQNAAHAELWQNIQASTTATLPYVVIQTKFRDRIVNSWHSTLSEAAESNLLISPVRTELAKRLLGGDSVVWLMLKSKDPARSKAARELLRSATETLSAKIELPEGVGLPGSELYSEIPLLLQFSVLEIDPDDKREQFLVKLLTSFQREAFADGDPLVIPVFGRGRALEVIPASTLNQKLVEELTVFLSGPCSCQVKDRNPGFDLLLSADWESELFGNEGERPPAVSVTEPDSKPKLLTIPPGRKR
jgi:hypothetical protein